MAALVEFCNQLLKLFQLKIADRALGFIIFIVHGANHINCVAFVKQFPAEPLLYTPIGIYYHNIKKL
jgi:hypothetical protein